MESHADFLRRADDLFDYRRLRRSEIVERITENEGDRMPPVRSKIDRLSPEEVNLIVNWIDQGTPNN